MRTMRSMLSSPSLIRINTNIRTVVSTLTSTMVSKTITTSLTKMRITLLSMQMWRLREEVTRTFEDNHPRTYGTKKISRALLHQNSRRRESYKNQRLRSKFQIYKTRRNTSASWASCKNRRQCILTTVTNTLNNISTSTCNRLRITDSKRKMSKTVHSAVM